ncbi:2-oxoacid:ferredoxin oxidoreductase subunit beta [Salinibacter altiplanensis]|uniref:2-oxoacid:ferredoxin oxidoreductase subunit beta n=1 Tax=Salinibacter altiplanensis TaxID=1803181 RepID=UPI000C9FA462|nr:thiamine pyrophosphate-dependent enzyme [Salinibacter altiplanensis]
MSTDSPDTSPNGQMPDGTKKPDRPPGLADGSDASAPNASDEEATPSTKKPDLPPGLGGESEESEAPGTKKPAGPPGAKKPAGPPSPGGDDADEDGPTLPPGYGGDGAGEALSREDFQSDQEVRWCPGCGDYAILSTVQRLLPDLGVDKENVVFISGIGCAGRFPYYMDTYGMHSIHGRAPAVATGLKTSNPELDVWVVTGDGDALSIGGNHLIHVFRRNLDTQILLFNNEIYGLTKGQYSPTSNEGTVSKSTPYGSVDRPFNPVSVALGADASFVARTMDRDPQHMKAMMRAAHEHDGTGFLEIYQNCNIFNDGAFFEFTERETKDERALFLEHGEPMTFANGTRGIRLDTLQPEVVDLEHGDWSADDCLVHDETAPELATILGRMSWQDDDGDPIPRLDETGTQLPRPFGVIHRTERPTYAERVHQQIDAVTAEQGEGDLDALLRSGETWTIE